MLVLHPEVKVLKEAMARLTAATFCPPIEVAEVFPDYAEDEVVADLWKSVLSLNSDEARLAYDGIVTRLGVTEETFILTYLPRITAAALYHFNSLFPVLAPDDLGRSAIKLHELTGVPVDVAWISELGKAIQCPGTFPHITEEGLDAIWPTGCNNVEMYRNAVILYMQGKHTAADVEWLECNTTDAQKKRLDIELIIMGRDPIHADITMEDIRKHYVLPTP